MGQYAQNIGPNEATPATYQVSSTRHVTGPPLSPYSLCEEKKDLQNERSQNYSNSSKLYGSKGNFTFGSYFALPPSESEAPMRHGLNYRGAAERF